ncbi:hypothetical protein NEHOM01_1094 [Nematocida homosporus]|uniref:uncharacterized protein n=1 Tax=Nematocida homosporus TaxID=1912981 RepID=UPI00221EFA3E|nr:uncharacterized protein NEHOM01_1094 [Nematocida homosporus]KAI5185817.1 hypothetical protein NEHOM01_1094 [Nematocida homosporus]
MFLSLRLSKLLDAYLQNNSKYELERFIASRDCLPIHKLHRVVAGLYWIGRIMCVLIVLLSKVDGSSMVAYSELPTAEEIVETLTPIGFWFCNQHYAINVRPYTLSQPLDAVYKETPVSNTRSDQNPSLSNTPLYVIEYADSCVFFGLPIYIEEDRARADLDELRKIATIRTTTAIISYEFNNASRYVVSLQILSRAIHIFDCSTLCFDLNASQETKEKASSKGLAAARIEAQNTLDHADYTTACTLKFSSVADIGLFERILSSIVLLRPVIGINLEKETFHSVAHISKFSLTGDYTLAFEHLPASVSIDFGFLQNSSTKCSQITIKDFTGTKIALTGLKDVTTKHPTLALQANWRTIFYLGRHSKSLIEVNTIMGPDINQDSNEIMMDALNKQSPPKPRLCAAKAIFNIPDYMSCDPFDYYTQLYSTTTFANLGIAVSNVQIDYKENRNDFFTTIKILCHLSNLSRAVLDEIQEQHIRCEGKTLSIPGWKFPKPLIIRLDNPQVDSDLNYYQAKHYLCFCQNITYTNIRIDGHPTPYDGQIETCIVLLVLFQNITAHELRLSNLYDNNQITSEFDLDVLKREPRRGPKWHLDVDILVLNNVDERIIYWMLGSYIFQDSMQVYIMNQRFTNLAIAQVLALPRFQSIASLVINDFLELNEVIYYHNQAAIQGFSFFEYTNSDRLEDKLARELTLRKLVLQLDSTEISLHSDVLSTFLRYGIQYQIVHPKAQTIRTSTSLMNAIILARDNSTLYNVTLEAIKADLLRCQAACQYLTLPNQLLSNQPIEFYNYSVQKLFLRFGSNQVLTEPNLVTVLRWITWRFSNLNVLRLTNAIIPKKEQKTITSRNYLLRAQEVLLTVRLEDTTPTTPPIELLIRPCPDNEDTLTTNSEVDCTVVAYTTLRQLAVRPDKFKDLIPDHFRPKESLQATTRQLKKKGQAIVCTACSRRLHPVSSRIGWKRFMCTTNTNSPTKPTDNDILLCYLQCGHPLCSICILEIYNRPNKDSPCCQQQCTFMNSRRLISAPLSSFIFIEPNYTPSTINQEWLKTLVWHDNLVYFYLPYKGISDLSKDLNQESIYTPTTQFHII